MNTPTRTGNLLLDALPEYERAEVLARGYLTHLRLNERLYEQGEEVQHVHFPTSGAASVLVSLSDGRAMEPAIVGREGVLGFPMGLGDNRSRWQSVVQIEGEAYALAVDDLQEFLRRPGELGPLLIHYAGLLMTFVAQSGVCTQFHDLRQRSARWLLLMHDRAEGPSFSITHEWLAHMLGATRPAVTVELRLASHEGLIAQRRGSIQVLDRAGLERMACECYAEVQAAFDELVSAPNEREPHQGDYQPGEQHG